MADVKDILGVGRQPGSTEKPSAAKLKEKPKRPKSMSREAFALLGNEVNLTTTQLPRPQEPKEKPSLKLQVTYRYKAFKNEARNDDLELHHWVKYYKDEGGRVREAETGAYAFAQLNKQCKVMTYNDEEYESIKDIQSESWSREETDYLIGLCKQFDLRWNVIADRYQYSVDSKRGIDDLKYRYYHIAAALLEARAVKAEDYLTHPLCKTPFNIEREEKRKAALARYYQKTEQQEKEEEEVIKQAQSVYQKLQERDADLKELQEQRLALQEAKTRKRHLEENQAQGNNPSAHNFSDFTNVKQYSNNVGSGTPSLLDQNMQPVKLAPGVYARGKHGKEMVDKMAQEVASNAHTQKVHDSLMESIKLDTYYTMMTQTRQVISSYMDLRHSLVRYAKEQKRLNGRSGDGGDDRERRRPTKKKKMVI